MTMPYTRHTNSVTVQDPRSLATFLCASHFLPMCISETYNNGSF